jgi:hypothetical protein
VSTPEERATELAIAHDSRVNDLDECLREVKAAEERATELQRERDEAYADRDEYIDNAERIQKRAERAETALRGFLWLHNNMHNYGSERWRDLFVAAVVDARAALGETAP